MGEMLPTGRGPPNPALLGSRRSADESGMRLRLHELLLAVLVALLLGLALRSSDDGSVRARAGASASPPVTAAG